MSTLVARYSDPAGIFQADTCRPLEYAAARGEVDLTALTRGHYPGRPLEDGVLRSVCSLGYWDARRTQAWGLGWHRNEGIEVTFLERGSLAFGVDDAAHALSAGALTITRPWQLHRVGEPYVTASRLHWLILDVGVRRPNDDWRWPDWLVLSRRDMTELTRLLSHNEQPVWAATPTIARTWHELARVLVDDVKGREESKLCLGINTLMLAILELLQSKRLQLDSDLVSSLRTVRLFLNDLSRDPTLLVQPWTVEAMAAHCGLGTTRFVALCEQAVNESPARHLLRCRVNEAKRLLVAESHATISDIAHRCGFGSAQYFATAFRRIEGRAPSEGRAF
jgi:AraC-like DNA-binding protein